jgi:hypothetical protein
MGRAAESDTRECPVLMPGLKRQDLAAGLARGTRRPTLQPCTDAQTLVIMSGRLSCYQAESITPMGRVNR